MEIVVKGKTIQRIKTLHLSTWGNAGENIHDDNFVIYDEYDPNVGDDVTRTLYFNEMDLESISI